MAVPALLLWAGLIAWVDWRTRRIPNVLLVLMLVPALMCLIVFPHGLSGADRWASALGFCTLLLGLPGYALGQFGAGDVKLMGVMGLILGWPAALVCLLASALLLGAMSLFVVGHLGLRPARHVRLPGGVALAGGFAGTVVATQQGWL
jgi:prepilin peptidase CpaA